MNEVIILGYVAAAAGGIAWLLRWAREDGRSAPQYPEWLRDAQAWTDMQDTIQVLRRSRRGDDAVWLAELAGYLPPTDRT